MTEETLPFADSKVRGKIMEQVPTLDVGERFNLKFPASEYGLLLTLLSEMIEEQAVFTDAADRRYAAFVCRAVSSLFDRAAIIGPSSVFDSTPSDQSSR